jgi:hypothetical protein
MKAPLLVPVPLKGGVMHDTDCARGAGSREEAAQINAKLLATIAMGWTMLWSLWSRSRPA